MVHLNKEAKKGADIDRVDVWCKDEISSRGRVLARIENIPVQKMEFKKVKLQVHANYNFISKKVKVVICVHLIIFEGYI